MTKLVMFQMACISLGSMAYLNYIYAKGRKTNDKRN